MSSGVAPSTETVLRRLFWKLFLRGRALSRARNKEGTVRSHAGMIWAQLAFYLVFGFLMCSAATNSDTMTFALMLHGITLFLVVFQMVMTAGSVLFNKEEAEILLHRPILPRELLRAKITVMCGYSAMLSAALNLPAMITSLTLPGANWLFPIAHACSTLLLIIFCAGTIVVIYQACLRWLGRERLDGLMTTMQTLLTVMLVLASQSFRFMARAHLNDLAHSPWILAMPPMWFAALDVVISAPKTHPGLIIPALTGVAATLLVAWLGFNRLADTYGEGLALMNETGGAPAGESSAKKSGRLLLRRLTALPPLSWWLRDPVERSGFLLAGAYFLRDRETKLRIYPAMAQVIAMPVFMVFAVNSGWAAAFAGTYMGWLPLMAIQILEFSDQWRATDIFLFTPLGKWQPLFHGVRKATLLLFALPAVFILSVVTLLYRGDGGSLFLYLVPGFIAIPSWSLVPALADPWLPLSKSFDSRAQSARSCIMMPIMLAISGILATATWYSLAKGFFVWFLLGETAIAAGAFFAMRAMIARAGEWEDA
ncbi:MAG TPA: hypothetical protein VG733_05045 [Chthoniobacteraceae bacterium]|nr:hypothetical protein [Chthoniobacteraceae bacterium]